MKNKLIFKIAQMFYYKKYFQDWTLFDWIKEFERIFSGDSTEEIEIFLLEISMK